MVHAITALTTTDLDSLHELLPIVDMAISLNSAHIYQVHIEGSTPTIGGINYVVPSASQIATAVQEFEHPLTPQVHHTAAPKPAKPTASASATSAAVPSTSSTAGPSTVYDWSAWQELARQTTLPLEAPTIWPAGLGYDTAGVPFRAYSVKIPDKHYVRAAIAVGTVVGGSWGATEYWGVQALAWKDPPAIADPSATRTIAGRTYLLFYHDSACTWSPGTRTARPTG